MWKTTSGNSSLVTFLLELPPSLCGSRAMGEPADVGWSMVVLP